MNEKIENNNQSKKDHFLKMNSTILSSFSFTAELNGRYKEFPFYLPLSTQCTSSWTINILTRVVHSFQPIFYADTLLPPRVHCYIKVHS